MNRYWDMSERDRAALTTDQVEAMMVVELMEKGVIKVEAPTLREIPELPLKHRTVFIVENGNGRYGSREDCGFCWDTIEQAQAFVATMPSKIDSDYQVGSHLQFAKPTRNLAIKQIEICDEQEILNHKAKLSKIEKDKEFNREAMSAHEKALTAQREAGKDVWEDYYRCGELSRKYAKIAAVMKDYVTTCNGDVSMASKFLGKAFSASDISAAAEWLDDVNLQLAASPQVAEASL